MAGHPLNYEPYPEVQPQGGPEARQTIHADPDMFGAAIGRGLGQLGQGIEHADNAVFGVAEMQAHQDAQTHANEVHTWQSGQVTDAQEKFNTLRGKDAEMALPAFKQQIEDIHRQARDQAGNPYTAQLIDSEGRRLTDVAYAQSARHAAQQKSVWDTTTATDGATASGNRAVIGATTTPDHVAINANPSVVLSLGRSDDYARQAAQLKGLDGETEVMKNRGVNVKNIVEQLTRDGSPDGLKRAVDFFNSQKDKIDAGISTQIVNFLAAPLNTIAGQQRADEVMGRPPVASVPRVVADIPVNFVSAIKQTEGYDARPRWDVKQWTVGYGTRASGPDERITPEQAEARFNTEVSKAARIVDNVNPNLDAGTRAALTSLTFNTGDAWTHSGLGEKIRAGDLNGAREAFLQYNKVNGETDPGVAARRAREASWFQRGDISPAESIQPRIDKGTAMLRIIDDPELANRPQVQAAALAHINKIYEAYHFQDAQQSAAFSLKLNGSIAELRDTGQLTTPIQHEEFLNGFGPQKGEAAWADYQKDVQLGADMRSLAGQSPEQIAATYGRYANPKPGDDYGTQVQRRDQLGKAIEENQKAKDKDPAGFVIRRTDSGLASWKQFNELVSDKNATPGLRTAYAQMFAAKMLAEQERLGVPAESRKVAPDWFTGPIKDQISAAATSEDPKTRQAVPQLIAAQKELWGNYWPNIVPQIAPPGAAPLVKAIAAGADPVAMQRLLDIPKGESPAKILKEQNEVTAKNLNASLNTAFAPFLASMVGLQKDRDYSGYAALGTELGALYVRDGMSDSEAATKAFNDLVGSRYDFRDSYRIPKDPKISADDVQRGVYEATQQVQRVRNGDGSSPFGDLQLQHNDLGVYDNEADMRGGIARDGRFVTSPRNDGLNLLVGTKFVKNADGRPILLTWDQLQKMGGTKESRAAEAARAQEIRRGAAMTDVFTAPDDGGDLKSSDFSTSMVDRLGAQWADTLDPKNSLSGMWAVRRTKEAIAGGDAAAVGAGGDVDVYSGVSIADQQKVIDTERAAIPDISKDDAKGLLKQEGLTEQDVHLGEAPTHKLPVLKMQIAEAHTRRDRQAAIERGPPGFFPSALGAITSIGVGMIDPVNAAAFSIPVIGEARMGKILASAGDSILARGAARFGQGAAQGAVGTAVLQPADFWLHTRDGQDYTMAQAMESIVMGAGMGGAFHAGGGLVGDIRSRWRGQPLAGSPQDLLLRGLMTGTHVHADQLAEQGVPLEDVPGITPEPHAEAAPPSNKDIEDLIGKVEAQLLPAEPGHPAQALADLPQAAREDAVHTAMADIIAGRPTQAAEMLQIAADHDPRIAGSFEAWHGSPHDIDRFDISKIGTGEGAQAYGHGLYFAENEKVATQYARSTSGRDFIRKAQELYSEHDSPGDAHEAIAESKDFTPGQKRLLLALEKDDWLGCDYPHQAVSAALSDPNGRNWEMSPETLDAIKHVGNMYKVRISANQDHFLDWDEPLGEHPEPVRSKLRAAGFEDMQIGKDIYHSLVKYRPDQGGGTSSAGMKLSDLDATPEVASGRLRATGIHGIKYLDQGSRGGLTPEFRPYQEGGDFYVSGRKPREAGPFKTLDDAQTWIREHATRNFVVFDDKHIEITHKNGESVKREELIAEHKAQRAARKAPRGRAAADPATWSLFEHLASVGGLKPDPELRAIFGNDRGPFVPGFGPLIRKTGKSLDEALSSAKQHGYMFDAHDVENGTAGAGGRTSHGLTPNDLLDHLDAENRGQKLYKPTHIEKTKYDPEQEKHVIMGALEHELETSDAKVSDIDPKLLDRTVEIVHREGVSDVMEAYERAIMEDEERYNATADALRSDPETRNIPGWEAATDAGRASGDRGRHSENGREAGRSDDGARRANGQEPARAGQTGRSSPAVVAADPRWRQLADATPDYNEPETLAESEAAARLPEPASAEPAKSLTALEKAAADAEEVWRQLEPTLTEQERALVHDVMDQLKLDAEARSRIITDGVACLAGAIG